MIFAWFSLVDMCFEMDSRLNMRHSEETHSNSYQSSDMETIRFTLCFLLYIYKMEIGLLV